MLEVLVVIVLIMIVSAMAIFALQPTLQNAKFDSGMIQVLDQLRQAREYSITNHRYVQVSFPVVVVGAGTYPEVVTTQLNVVPFGPGGANTVISTIPIQPPAQFFLIPLAPDTPDGFGKTAPIVFENTNNGPPGGMMFQSDGEFVDQATFQPINGTVFLGQAGPKQSGRAITILGTTGRIRGWKFTGTTWFQF
jgi:type II secretory pathway pseudopilin PulG